MQEYSSHRSFSSPPSAEASTHSRRRPRTSSIPTYCTPVRPGPPPRSPNKSTPQHRSGPISPSMLCGPPLSQVTPLASCSPIRRSANPNDEQCSSTRSRRNRSANPSCTAAVAHFPCVRGSVDSTDTCTSVNRGASTANSPPPGCGSSHWAVSSCGCGGIAAEVDCSRSTGRSPAGRGHATGMVAWGSGLRSA